MITIEDWHAFFEDPSISTSEPNRSVTRVNEDRQVKSETDMLYRRAAEINMLIGDILFATTFNRLLFSFSFESIGLFVSKNLTKSEINRSPPVMGLWGVLSVYDRSFQ